MKLKFASACFALTFSSQIFAATIIEVPEEIVVISVNNQEVKSGLLKSKKKFEINSGSSLINVRYNHYFDLPLNNHEIVKSDILTLKTPELKDNQRYKLALVNTPKNLDQAKDFAKKPQLAIYDENNNLVGQNLIVQMTSQGLFGGSLNQIFSSNNNETVKVETVREQKSENVEPTKLDQKIAAKSIGTENPTSSADQQLIEIWKNASKTERQKFMSWLATQ